VVVTFFHSYPSLSHALPKGIVRGPTEDDCPFLVLSRTTKGQALSLPISELGFSVAAEQDAALVTTYMPEAEFNVPYFKSVPLIPRATIKQAFQQASSVAGFDFLGKRQKTLRKGSTKKLN